MFKGLNYTTSSLFTFQVIYESVPSSSPPYICYVTLPGGACFASYGVSIIMIKHYHLAIDKLSPQIFKIFDQPHSAKNVDCEVQI